MSDVVLAKAKETYELLRNDEACTGQATQVKKLVEKLENEDMEVAVIGQFKRGKSTLANAILKDNVLPVGIVPITSAVTKVVYGEKSAQVHFENGAVEDVEFEHLSKFISEQENENNILGVESVVLHTPSEFLRNGLTFVDTPGVGSFHKNNTETAYHNMKESDAVIFLLSVDSPINQIEIEFLNKAKEYAGKFYFAVNKIDVIGKDDLKSYLDYCSRLLSEIMDTDNISVFPVSGKTGEGIDKLTETIINDCKTSTREILEDSIDKKLKETIASALTQLDFYWKAMNMEYKELDERFDAVTKSIEEVKQKSTEYNYAFEIRLNELKHILSDKVLELFGMEYYYDVEYYGHDMMTMEKEDFVQQVSLVCDDLTNTLNRVLLYREENAYAVVRRINNINRLTRQLRKIKETL